MPSPEGETVSEAGPFQSEGVSEGGPSGERGACPAHLLSQYPDVRLAEFRQAQPVHELDHLL